MGGQSSRIHIAPSLRVRSRGCLAVGAIRFDAAVGGPDGVGVIFCCHHALITDTERRPLRNMAAETPINWAGSAGVKFRVTLISGEEFTSDLFALDSAASVLIFRQSPHHTYQKADYRIVPLHAVAAAVAVGPGDAIAAAPMPPTKAMIDAKVAAAERAELARQATIAFGVSPLAQFVFSAVNKTFACRWSGERIVVTDKVVISPPYGADRVQVAAGGDAAAYESQVAYVRKIVSKALPAFHAQQDAPLESPGSSGPTSPPSRSA